MRIDFTVSGEVDPGEYEKYYVSGSSSGKGLLRCTELHVSGSFRHEDVECFGEAHVSGSAKMKNFTAKEAHISGALKCEENITVAEEAKFSGSVNCGKNVKCGELKVSGAAKVGGDIEAEKVKISGAIECPGLINAEEIYIKLGGNNAVASLGGSKITVEQNSSSGGLLGRILFGKRSGKLEVAESIEGDEIYLEYTAAKTVIGKKVTVGEGCRIENLQYSEEVTVDPKAKVANCEKI